MCLLLFIIIFCLFCFHRLLQQQAELLEKAKHAQHQMDMAELARKRAELKAENERLAQLFEEERKAQIERDHARTVAEANAEIVNQIINAAKTFVKNHYDASMGPPTLIQENPGLLNGCRAMQLYCSGVQKMGGVSCLSSRSFCAWHGTLEAALAPICDGGFDTARRAGQAYGPGEYFGQSASVSSGYARGV